LVNDCDPQFPYRFSNGACNNLGKKWWGRSSTHFQRFAPAAYDDGVSAPREFSAKGDTHLPNPRTLAANILPPNPQMSTLSQAFTYFGQFVAHDLVRAAFGTVECVCSTSDPLCINIPIPSSEADPNFSSQKCIPLRRNLDSKSATFCNTPHREQFTLRTHWLDK
jgi:peroxidase